MKPPDVNRPAASQSRVLPKVASVGNIADLKSLLAHCN
jgi:hypothetical protein